jgi:diguanylate cyclase (GGDEF)-like protein
VYNRKYLEEFERFVNLNNYVLCVLDIDKFKEVNDTYGHDVGDKVLRDVAKLIVRNYRINEDVLIRYGGEEFCLFLKKDRSSQMSTLAVIDRLYSELKNTQFSVGHDKFINITLSVGINMHPYESRNFNEAFKLADEALYLAKKGGRDKVIIYPDVEYVVVNS